MTLTIPSPNPKKVVVGGLVAGRDWAIPHLLEGLNRQDTAGMDIHHYFLRDVESEAANRDYSRKTFNLRNCVIEEFERPLSAKPLKNTRPAYSLERLGLLRNVWLESVYGKYVPDYVLFIDSDIEFQNEDALHSLLFNSQCLPYWSLLAAPIKNSPAKNVFNFLWKTTGFAPPFEPRLTRVPPEGLSLSKRFQVYLSGACILIPKNSFHIKWSGNDEKGIGEDNGLADYCDACNIPIFVDPSVGTKHWMKPDAPETYSPGDFKNAFNERYG